MTNEQWKIVLETFDKFNSLAEGFILVGDRTKAEAAKRSSQILEECISNLLEEEKNEPVQVGDFVEFNPENEGPYLLAKSREFFHMGEGPFEVTGIFKFSDKGGRDARGICYSFSPSPDSFSLKSSSFFRKVKRGI